MTELEALPREDVEFAIGMLAESADDWKRRGYDALGALFVRVANALAEHLASRDASRTPETVYLVITYCEDHGGHGEAFRTLAGARAFIQQARQERIDDSVGIGGREEAADRAAAIANFERDTPDEVTDGEWSIRLEVDDLTGVPLAIPLGD